MGVSVTQRRPHLPDSVLHMLHRVLKRAGLPKVRFHDLRHTFATLALQNGVDIKTVSGMLGHYSAGFTLDTYAHVTTAAQKEAARAMGKVLANALWKYPKTKRGPGAAEPHPDLAFGSYGSEYGSTPKVQKSVSTFLSNKQGKPSDFKRNQTVLWSVRPIKMFAKTLYLQGFAGQRRLFFLFFGWDLADFLPKGDFSVRPKKISAYSYFFSF